MRNLLNSIIYSSSYVIQLTPKRFSIYTYLHSIVGCVPEASKLVLAVRALLGVLQLGEPAAQRQHATAEVGVRRELAPKVLGRAAVEQVAAARTLRHTYRG